MWWKWRYKADAGFLRGAEEMETARRFAGGRPAWLQWGAARAFCWNLGFADLEGLAPELVGMRVLHLSDLHLGPRWMPALDVLIDRLREDPPDLILFTGDFIENKWDHRPALSNVRRLVVGLMAKVGVYAILGNHDPQVLTPYVAKLGVRVLNQERAIVEARGARVEIVALPGCSRGDLDLEFIRGLPAREAGVPRVVMSHFPDVFPATRGLEADLFLAGHTHGGQVCLPKGWPPITHDRMPRKLAKGVHRIGRTWYAVSRGFGYSGVPVRVCCPMEVSEFRLGRVAT
jgi:predicted MPP superfamily phosphohydrolase